MPAPPPYTAEDTVSRLPPHDIADLFTRLSLSTPVAQADFPSTSNAPAPEEEPYRLYSFQNSVAEGLTETWEEAASQTQGIPQGRPQLLTPKSKSKKRIKKGGYAVFHGRRSGAFRHWYYEVEPLVIGVSNSLYQGYPTMELARAAFEYAQQRGWTRIIGSQAAASPSLVVSPISNLPTPIGLLDAPNALHTGDTLTGSTCHPMARGRKRLNPEVKAQRRKEALTRYAEKRSSAMQPENACSGKLCKFALPLGSLIATSVRANIKAAGPETAEAHRLLGRQAAARYRESNRHKIRAADILKRAQKCIEEEGSEVYEEKAQRRSMTRTQRRHEGRPPPARLTTLPKKISRRRSPSPSSADDTGNETDDAEDRARSQTPSRLPDRVLPAWATCTLPPSERLPPCSCDLPVNMPREGAVQKKKCPPPKPGSSKAAPFLVDENGEIVKSLGVERRRSGALSSHARASPLSTLGAYWQPPTAEQEARRRAAREKAMSASLLKHGWLWRQAGIRPQGPLIIRKIRRDGLRADREEPLSEADLYLDDARPPVHPRPKEKPARLHHACAICLNLKSHPVFYQCGHGHCYVCVRKWLETSWQCPTCRCVMTTQPVPSYDAMAAIDFDYPEWRDKSRVNLSWEGLTFPKPRLYYPDSP
ncbi:hypothetical protein C8R43DRAFT_1124242 [Mycena crocata]|nr:hypothetical protein C8R43DRAFT_1124242 [Mycena crocata]